jgi:hypothetical protein
MGARLTFRSSLTQSKYTTRNAVSVPKTARGEKNFLALLVSTSYTGASKGRLNDGVS